MMSLDSRWILSENCSNQNAAPEPKHVESRINNELLGELFNDLSSLPSLPYAKLTYDKLLGQGSSFLVTRELFHPVGTDPYYVAVKYMNLRGTSEDELQRAYKAVKREIRVLTHPPLKNHSSLIRALGYGWAARHNPSPDPFLVLEYSPSGTIDSYIMQRSCRPTEIRELALDIAVGLKVLHENKLVHGDIKPHNILVFDENFINFHGPISRQVAKISDFGNVLSEEEIVANGYRPAGTLKYMAPEIAFGNISDFAAQTEESFSFENICKSDIFSFGLLLWEMLKWGESCFERSWCQEYEYTVDMRRRIYANERNGMSTRCVGWIARHMTDLYTWEYHPEYAKVISIMRETAILCLQDRLSERAESDEVVNMLAEGTNAERSQIPYPTAMTLPFDGSKGHGSLLVKDVYHQSSCPPAQQPQTEGKAKDPPEIIPGVYSFRKLAKNEKPTYENRVVARTRGEATRIPACPTMRSTNNIFEIPLDGLPPWNIQMQMFRQFTTVSQVKSNTTSMASALLQLSACYLIGFGTTPSVIECLATLREAAKYDKLANAVLLRAGPALLTISQTSVLGVTNLHQAGIKEADERHKKFSLHFRESQLACGRSLVEIILKRMNGSDMQNRLLSPANHISSAVLEDRTFQKLVRASSSAQVNRILRSIPYHHPEQLSLYLTLACQFGFYETARELALTCTQFVHTEARPTPLHWLISFDDEEAAKLATLLVNGCDETAREKGLLAEFLDSVINEPAMFPEHAMELFGTPLHWAARVGSVPLVKTLIELGANIDARCIRGKSFVTDVNWTQSPWMSPLDLAAAYHQFEVVEFLLSKHAAISGGGAFEHHTALHLVGQAAHPLARLVAHGEHYYSSLQRTMQALLSHGSDINAFGNPYADDELSWTPLRAAIHDLLWEDFIIMALLDNGANEPSQLRPKDLPLGVLIARVERNHPSTAWKMSRVLHLVKDVNETDADGYNALHWCATSGNSSMAEHLFNKGPLNVCAEFEKGSRKTRFTPLMFAAINDRAAMVRWLVSKGVSLEEDSENEQQPLEAAVRMRSLDAIEALLEANAKTDFDLFEGLPRNTILHQAVIGPDKKRRSKTFMSTLLDRCPTLKTTSIVNSTTACFGPALHWAIYRGDVEAVQSLLNAGADLTLVHRPDRQYSNIDPLAGTPVDVARKTMRTLEIRDEEYRFHDHREWLKGSESSLNDPSGRDMNLVRSFRNDIEEIHLMLQQHLAGESSENGERAPAVPASSSDVYHY